MRILSYNILDGGEGRADPIAEVLAAHRPDVVCLIEADHPPTVERISKRLSMDAVIGPGGRHPVALLSRHPIAWSIDHAALANSDDWSLLQVCLDLPNHHPLPVGVVHLSPRAGERDEQKRELQIARILNVFDPDRRAARPHVLAGDFNANAPSQIINPALCKKSTQKSYSENGGQIPRRAIAMLLNAGYTDTLQAAAPDRAPTTGTFTTQHPGQRVDYIFTWGNSLMVQNAWVEQDRLAKYASDHFPIGAEVIENVHA